MDPVWERKEKSEDEEAYWKYLETNVPMKAIGDPSDIFHANEISYFRRCKIY